MPERLTPGPISGDTAIREAVCVHTDKIYDSCKGKDCLEDLRVYLTQDSQNAINNAVSVRARCAELIYALPVVEPVSFNRGFYSVDVRFFYKITGEAYSPVCKSVMIKGLAVYDKRVILFGSEGNAKIFSSDTTCSGIDLQTIQNTNLPTAFVEAVDPIVLNMTLTDFQSPCHADNEVFEVPNFISALFEDSIVFENQSRRLFVTLGQFSIIRLERDSQLLIPTYDYCMPDKECVGGSDNDPCALFADIDFPVDEFFPPDTVSCPEGYREALAALTP